METNGAAGAISAILGVAQLQFPRRLNCSVVRIPKIPSMGTLSCFAFILAFLESNENWTAYNAFLEVLHETFRVVSVQINETT